MLHRRYIIRDVMWKYIIFWNSITAELIHSRETDIPLEAMHRAPTLQLTACILSTAIFLETLEHMCNYTTLVFLVNASLINLMISSMCLVIHVRISKIPYTKIFRVETPYPSFPYRKIFYTEFSKLFKRKKIDYISNGSVSAISSQTISLRERFSCKEVSKKFQHGPWCFQ